MFLFGRLPVEIQQELTIANKEECSPEEINTYLNVNTSTSSTQRRQPQYSHLTRSPPLTQRRIRRPNQQPRRRNPNGNVLEDSVSTVARPATAKVNVAPDKEMRPMGLRRKMPS